MLLVVSLVDADAKGSVTSFPERPLDSSRPVLLLNVWALNQWKVETLKIAEEVWLNEPHSLLEGNWILPSKRGGAQGR